MKLTIADIRRANKDAGRYFFSPDTMRFFASKVERYVYQGAGGVFFVTSEKSGFDPDSPRCYTVRRFDPVTADVDTRLDPHLGPFCTLIEARSRARVAAAGSADK